ncbi:MAG: hypothetical protein U9Q72_00005 [Patescibacteria group bacterium]|nr:hypothetical protein [Patescibacteria group bacterium]
MKKKDSLEILGNKQTRTIITIAGTIFVIGIILYKEKGNLSPMLMMGVASVIVLTCIFSYIAFLKKRKKHFKPKISNLP